MDKQQFKHRRAAQETFVAGYLLGCGDIERERIRKKIRSRDFFAIGPLRRWAAAIIGRSREDMETCVKQWGADPRDGEPIIDALLDRMGADLKEEWKEEAVRNLIRDADLLEVEEFANNVQQLATLARQIADTEVVG